MDSVGIDYLRKPSRVSSLQKISNATVRSEMQAEQSVLGRIQRSQLKWYGYLLRMENSRPKKIYQWTSHSRRRRRRRQRQSWKKRVTDFTRSRNMEEDRHLSCYGFK